MTGRGDWAGPNGELDRLMFQWRWGETIRRARAIVQDHTDAYVRGQARLFALTSMINLGLLGDPIFENALQRARAELNSVEEPALQAELQVVLGVRADHNGDINAAISHVAAAQRALTQDTGASMASCVGWADLSTLESRLSLTDQALTANQHAEQFDRYERPWRRVGLLLDTALTKDHHGDVDACVALLEQAAYRDTDQRGENLEGDSCAETYRAYARARLAALGVVRAESPETYFPTHESDPISACNRRLIRACLAIAAGEPFQALLLLEGVTPPERSMGVEILRLRALAHAVGGEHRAALFTEREMFRAATDNLHRMRGLAVAGVDAAKEQSDLREALRIREGEAFTDRLTGLSNRRHLEVSWSGLLHRYDSVVVGMLDLDHFKAVNTNHGHQVGDQVLRRAAHLLQAGLRGDDFLARFGGDEFVAVLPETSLAEAHLVGSRLQGQLAGEDWSRIGSGIKVGVTIGWSTCAKENDLAAVLRDADQAMYMGKHHR